MAVVTMRQLLESGVHFGHQTRRWNPKMKRFIFTERNGIYIIDLQRSLRDIDRAYSFVKETVAHGGSILFVGTKKQAQEPVAEQAARVGMPYVNQRWLGGMLTNFGTVHKRLQRLKELEELDFDDVAGSGLTKKELLVLKREKDKLERSLGGIRDMAKVPSAVWVIDTKKEHLAVAEARKLKIPVIAILDTNCDPDEVDYGIPGNDDAIRSVALLTRVIADAVAEGVVARHSGAAATTGGSADVEPLAEWERELLAADGEVTPPAAQTPPGGAGDVDEETAPEVPASEEAAPAEAAPEVAAPEVTAPEEAAPAEAAPEVAAPEVTAPEESAPESSAAEESGPAQAASAAPAEPQEPLTEAVPVEDAWPVAATEPADDAEPVPGTRPVIGAEEPEAEQTPAAEPTGAKPSGAKPGGKRRTTDEA